MWVIKVNSVKNKKLVKGVRVSRTLIALSQRNLILIILTIRKGNLNQIYPIKINCQEKTRRIKRRRSIFIWKMQEKGHQQKHLSQAGSKSLRK